MELTIATTLACNLRCVYCFEEDKPPVPMTPGDEANVVRFVRTRLDGVRQLSVLWFGGEPLANVDSILRLSAALVRLCSFSGVAYTAGVVTNGVLLTPELARRLRAAHVREARVTIDGPREIHDLLRPTAAGGPTYDRVLEGIDVARRWFDVVVGINVARSNARRIPELLRELAGRGLHDVSIMFTKVNDPDMGNSGPEMPKGRGIVLTMAEFAREEVRLLECARDLGLRVVSTDDPDPSLPCNAVRPNHFVLEPNGLVKRCYADVTVPSRAVGTVHDGSFEATPEDERWAGYELLDAECASCRFLPICHGGCPTLRMNGIDKAVAVCTARRFNMEDLLRRGLA